MCGGGGEKAYINFGVDLRISEYLMYFVFLSHSAQLLGDVKLEDESIEGS